MTNKEQIETIVTTMYYALRDIWFDSGLIGIMLKYTLHKQDFITHLNDEIKQNNGKIYFDINVRKGYKKYLVKCWIFQNENQQKVSAIEVWPCS